MTSRTCGDLTVSRWLSQRKLLVLRIKQGNVIALIDKLVYQMAANEACPTGNISLHKSNLDELTNAT